MPEHTAPWTEATLFAIDIEGSGPQDPEGEAILEIALIPIRDGAPDTANAYSTLINPRRKITRGPWTSPGITNAVLQDAPTLDEVAPAIIDRLAGATLVGHNVRVDWRLLHATIPAAAPDTLIDTLRLARHRHPELRKGHGLQAWLERLSLADEATRIAAGSQPHRALWDTAGTALLLREFMTNTPDATLGALLTTAGLTLDGTPITAPAPPDAQPSLWDIS